MEGERPFSLSAAVLAGGQSRRMGTDKALLPLAPGGKPMLELALDRLREVADDVTIIATGRPEYAAFGAPVVPDEFPGTGTLGGIATALRNARHERCLVVACDMPFLNPELLAAMAAWPGTWQALAPTVAGESRQGGGEIVQTLHAIYGKSCLPAIERRLAAGELKVIGFFPDVEVVRIPERVIRGYDPELRSFFNANTLASLESARSSAAGPE